VETILVCCHNDVTYTHFYKVKGVQIVKILTALHTALSSWNFVYINRILTTLCRRKLRRPVIMDHRVYRRVVPSNVYHRLGPTPNIKYSHSYLAHSFHNHYKGSKVRYLASIFDPNRLEPPSFRNTER